MCHIRRKLLRHFRREIIFFLFKMAAIANQKDCVEQNFDMEMEEARKQLLPNSELKEEQRKVLMCLKNGSDTIACLPTGFGKCLQ